MCINQASCACKGLCIPSAESTARPFTMESSRAICHWMNCMVRIEKQVRIGGGNPLQCESSCNSEWREKEVCVKRRRNWIKRGIRVISQTVERTASRFSASSSDHVRNSPTCGSGWRKRLQRAVPTRIAGSAPLQLRGRCDSLESAGGWSSSYLYQRYRAHVLFGQRCKR